MAKNLRTYLFSLKAGVEYSVDVDGDVFSVTSVADSTKFTISFDESARFAGITQGMGGKFLQSYNRVVLLSPVDNTVEVVLGFGEFIDSRATLSATLNTSIEPGNIIGNGGDVTIAATTTALCLAASSTNLECILRADPDNVEPVRVGGAGVGAANGMPLDPGDSISLSTVGAVYAYNPHSAGQKIHTIVVGRV